MPQPTWPVLAALLANAAMWGAAYPAMKTLLAVAPASAALGLRFALAAVVVLPLAGRRVLRPGGRRWGVAIGATMLAIYSLLAVGLAHRSSSRCAFIMATTVAFVQVGQIVAQRRVEWAETAAVGLSLAGVTLVTGWDLEPPGAYDAVVMAAAILSASGLALVHRATRTPGHSPDVLTFYQLATLAIGSLARWGLEPSRPIVWTAPAVGSLLFLALLPSALAQRLQMLYQRHASPSLAAMIYALKPVFAALVAAVWLGERMRAGAFLGAGMMLAATFGAPGWRWWQERRRAG